MQPAIHEALRVREAGDMFGQDIFRWFIFLVEIIVAGVAYTVKRRIETQSVDRTDVLVKIRF